MSEGIEYPRLLREATLGLVRRLLERAAVEGLPGEHHFYLTFDTRAPGVDVAASLRSRYPETMTIVIQHQWADLTIDDEAFAVTLRFGGVWERLRVPWAALASFLDPSVPFGLDFTQFADAEAADAAAADSAPVGEEAGPEALAEEAPAPPEAGGGAEILPFRRR